MIFRVTRAPRELVDEVVFLAGFHDHPPEAIREVDLLPVDLPFAICLEHEEEQGPQGRSEFLYTFLVLRRFGRFVDRWVGEFALPATAGEALVPEVDLRGEVEDDPTPSVRLRHDGHSGKLQPGRDFVPEEIGRRYDSDETRILWYVTSSQMRRMLSSVMALT